ncbi:BTB/POZ domain-containing protein 9-like [Drosophila miranda]|uniref:BTB/POZ domain-containing protein 9-like n=1 Tax=Drosophila miranda TaxID=7229 RepID=UPI0007E80CD6|nr:BTB/POZ domain-containing protein 9-like [Drosophila miranda]XP_033241948.1 BTB/POZ domain-containing protein 9-like [Drosophila miranda]XP_033241949.1 BTB/POZ domain-containing protein 9-like [Drosophila miranda]
MDSQESSATSSSAAKRHRSSKPKPVHVFGDQVLKDLGSLCMNELYSDVTFFVEEHCLPAHRLILATRSEYFRALLFGGMFESTEQKVRLEAPLDAFKVILGYLYSGTLAVSTLDVDATSKVLGLASLYILPEVELALAKHLQNNLSISNTCMILDTARKFNLAELTMKCLKFMDKNAPQVLKHQSFDMLSKESLEEVLRRDTLIEHEINVFQSVLKWSRHNQGVDIKSVLSLVRLPLISVEDLVRVVRPSGIVESLKILDAIEKPIITSILPYRAHVSPGVDVAFHLGSGFGVNQNEIVIKLSFWCIINNISIVGIQNTLYKLYTKNTSNCTVEVSCDMIHWDDVGNIALSAPTQQDIRFARRPVRFIRIVHPESGRKDILNDVLLKAILNNTIP